jgi:hypothetical protein
VLGIRFCIRHISVWVLRSLLQNGVILLQITAERPKRQPDSIPSMEGECD